MKDWYNNLGPAVKGFIEGMALSLAVIFVIPPFLYVVNAWFNYWGWK